MVNKKRDSLPFPKNAFQKFSGNYPFYKFYMFYNVKNERINMFYMFNYFLHYSTFLSFISIYLQINYFSTLFLHFFYICRKCKYLKISIVVVL